MECSAKLSKDSSRALILDNAVYSDEHSRPLLKKYAAGDVDCLSGLIGTCKCLDRPVLALLMFCPKPDYLSLALGCSLTA